MLNQPFRKHARTGRPLVVFKSAMTLDGKVATRTGDSQWISGEASRARAHRWRAESDAVAVGIGTALDGRPAASPRAIEGVARQPRRVVFDSEARLPLDSQLVRGVAELPLIVVCSRAASRTSVRGARVRRRGRDRGHRRERGARAWSTRSTSSARATSSRCCSRAARTWPARSSRPARSTRRGCSSRRSCSAARRPRPRWRASASGRSRRAARALAIETERIEDDVLIVVARFKEW